MIQVYTIPSLPSVSLSSGMLRDSTIVSQPGIRFKCSFSRCSSMPRIMVAGRWLLAGDSWLSTVQFPVPFDGS